MGFRQPDLTQAVSAIRKALAEIHSPYNDGWVASGCKKELYLLKCWLEDQYNDLPTFAGEEEWEKEREKDQVLQILKR